MAFGDTQIGRLDDVETPNLGVSTKGYPNDVETPKLGVSCAQIGRLVRSNWASRAVKLGVSCGQLWRFVRSIGYELDDVETPNLGVSFAYFCSGFRIIRCRWGSL
jgi:hypothetical protein